MRRNIHKYTLHWNQRGMYGNNQISLKIGRQAADLFDKLFLKDYEKHQLLQEITIDLTVDDCHLFGLARFLLYFNEHYSELFVERKLYLKHFKQISIKYNEIENGKVNGKHTKKIQLPHQKSFAAADTRNSRIKPELFNKLFMQKMNEKYSIEKNVIQIKQMVLTDELESFGVIYQNVLNWLQQRQVEYSVNGCKIVFVI